MRHIRAQYMSVNSRYASTAAEVFMEEHDVVREYPPLAGCLATIVAVEHDGRSAGEHGYRDEKILGAVMLGVKNGQVEFSRAVIAGDRPEEVTAALGIKCLHLEAAVTGRIPDETREEEVFDQIMALAGAQELVDSNR